MNRLQAMKDQRIRACRVDVDDELMVFPNGVELPIIAFWDASRTYELADPVDGGWIEFGNDETGFGWYPCRMISEEEWLEQQR